MSTRRMFDSRIESRIALPVILAVSVLVLGITSFAMEQIRAQSVRHAEATLQRVAKDYGMLIAERLRTASDYDRRSGFSKPTQQPRPRLWLEGDLLRVVFAPEPAGGISVPLTALLHDVDDIAHVERCVAVKGVSSCEWRDPDMLVHEWPLRLVSLFETDLTLLVHAAQHEQDAVAGIALIVDLLPYAATLFAALVGYVMVLYLRRRFRPVPALSEAIKRIEQGHFDQRLDIETDDEFAQLGRALNSLSAELGESFGFLRNVTEIDELILANARTEEIIDTVCRAAVAAAGVQSAVVALLADDQAIRIQGYLYGQEYIASVPHPDSRNVPQIAGFEGSVFVPVLRERVMAGWLVIQGEIDEARAQELARKVSVGLTNISRSESLFRQATYDGLTGLLNRLAFVFRLDERVRESRRSEGSGAVLFLDLDEFKNVNDVQGHSTGDALLRVVAERLSACVRETDVVARLGGDEFALVINAFEDRQDLIRLLNRITEEISRPTVIDQVEHLVHCSIGVCLYPQDGDSTEALLKNADVAMYRAKAMSGSTFVFFNQSLNEETERRVAVERRLRQALQNRELMVHLQPKMALDGQRIDSFEALLRWHDTELGGVPPVEFIDVAERAGLISEVTELVVEQIAGILADHRSVRSIAINISPVMLSQPQFVERFLGTLHNFGCDPDRIELEITESVFIDDAQAVTSKLDRLKRAGLHISLDDFGTGFSSLNLLRQLPLDAVKIDKSFVDDLCRDEQARLLVGKIIEIAKGLGMDVVAEGVEDIDQLRLLASMGCTYVQGYLIAKPAKPSVAVGYMGERQSFLLPVRSVNA